MDRKALLIGNSNGLPGVKKDIRRWVSFLKSDPGGKWYKSEIDIVMNPSKSDLLYKIDSLKDECYDFVIVVYSGHGAYSKGTLLEINDKEELVGEDDLKNIAPRQISVFDCCRGLTQMSDVVGESLKFRLSSSVIRDIYDKRIMEAIPQQLSLYACSVGEAAYDSNEGGYYTKNLLKSALSFRKGQRFLTVGGAHQEAAVRTTAEVKREENAIQRPDAFLPRCLSSQELIISINPQYGQ